MDALHAVLAIMLVGTVGIAPSSCTTMGGGTNDGGMTGKGDGGGGGGYLIQFPSEFTVPWTTVPHAAPESRSGASRNFRPQSLGQAQEGDA